MKYSVYLIDDVEEDILEIYSYIQEHDCQNSADFVLENLEKVCESFEHMPNRGHIPPELLRINVAGYLEVHFKPYRIIYEIDEKKVFVHCVLDGRREINDMLMRRILR